MHLAPSDCPIPADSPAPLISRPPADRWQMLDNLPAARLSALAHGSSSHLRMRGHRVGLPGRWYGSHRVRKLRAVGIRRNPRTRARRLESCENTPATGRSGTEATRPPGRAAVSRLHGARKQARPHPPHSCPDQTGLVRAKGNSLHFMRWTAASWSFANCGTAR